MTRQMVETTGAADAVSGVLGVDKLELVDG